MRKIVLSILILVVTFAIILISCKNDPSKTSVSNVTEENAKVNDSNQAPGSYIIFDNSDKITMPFKFYGMNLMVDAKMNGIDIKMLIDNGVMWDELLFYGSEQVDSLGIIYDGDIHVEGAGEGKGIESYTASDLSISFGDVQFNEQSAVITPKEQGFADYFPGIAGQVCGAFFKHFVVEFNFDDSKLTLHKPGTFKYFGNSIPVKMTRDSSGSYSIPLKIKLKGKNEIDYKLFIDLGGIYPVSLVTSEKYGIEKPNSERILLGYGASGEINGYKTNLDYVKIADYKLDNVSSVIIESDNDGDHTNVTIGLPLLMRFNLIFDYRNETLYLEPNNQFNDPFDEN